MSDVQKCSVTGKRALTHGAHQSSIAHPATLLIETKASRELVVCCCERASSAGVRPGMTVAHARALLPDEAIHIEHHSPLRDLAALRALAHWATRFSPIVAIDPPDGLLLDISGCERLFRGERNLINRIADALEQLGFHVRVATASTFACAQAVARFGRRQRSMVPTGREGEALGPLPVRALLIDQEADAALREIAIDRIEHLFDLPRNALPPRFGPELLLRLDQALGQAMEAIEPVRPAPPPVTERLFNGPVRQPEAIEITARELLEELSHELLRRESGACDLRCTLDRSDLDPLHLDIALSRPSRNVKHLFSLLRPHLERANMGYGVEGVTLEAKRIGTLPHEQIHHVSSSPHRPIPAVINASRGELLDTLSNRLGRDHVFRLWSCESHVPERAFRFVSVMQGDGETSEVRNQMSGRDAMGKRSVPVPTVPDHSITGRLRLAHGTRNQRTTNNQQRTKDNSSITPHDRPTVLFDDPEPIEVISVLPESPPSWIRFVKDQREHEVISGIGPERIAGEWWNTSRHEGTKARRLEEAAASTPNDLPSCFRASLPGVPTCLSDRNYYRIAIDTGEWLWVFRDLESGLWFVHGRWA